MFPYNQQVANLLGYSTITNDSRHPHENVNGLTSQVSMAS